MGKPTNTSKFYENEYNKSKNKKNSKFVGEAKEKGIVSLLDSQSSLYPNKKAYLENIKNYVKETKHFLEEKKTDDDFPYNELGKPLKSWTKAPRKDTINSDTESTSNEEKNENEKEAVSKKWKKKKDFKGGKEDFKKKRKTELCNNWMNGNCKYGDKCAYAHGESELLTKLTNTVHFRTRPCKNFFKNGYCPYGVRCQFAHLLKSNVINNPYDTTLMTYSKIIDTISKKENIPNLKMLVEKPRLKVFENLAPNKENIPSRLLEDIKEIIH